MNLPPGSVLLARFNPSHAWTVEEHLLFRILKFLGDEAPYPWDKPEGVEHLETESMTIEEFEAWHSGNFEEVDGCLKV